MRSSAPSQLVDDQCAVARFTSRQSHAELSTNNPRTNKPEDNAN
jgi:hypothetical protein